ILYGTTLDGGIYDDGTVFAFDPAAGAETVLYSFCLKGEYCLDGTRPGGSLIEVHGKLYGTTSGGGANLGEGYGGGTVSSLDPATSKERVIYSFCAQKNCTDGAGPGAGVIYRHGTFYGTTTQGGTGTGRQGFYGTAFALDRKTRAETVLH